MDMTGTLLLVALFPLVENVILLPHAGKYSFERLKFAVPLAIAICAALAVAMSFRPKVSLMIGLLLVAGGARQNIQSYHAQNAEFGAWRPVAARNASLVKEIFSAIDPQCTLFASSGTVRGYTGTVLGRSAYEHFSIDALASEMASRRACSAVLISQTTLFHDIPEFTGATILRPGRPALTIVP